MTKEKLTEVLKIAYRWGRDNGSNRSDKNFNDLLQTKVIGEALTLDAVNGSAYLIKLGNFIESGYLEQMGTNEEAIKKIITEAAKRNDLPGVKEIIEVELVDLFHLVVHYKYKDWFDEIEKGQLFLSKFSLVS